MWKISTLAAVVATGLAGCASAPTPETSEPAAGTEASEPATRTAAESEPADAAIWHMREDGSLRHVNSGGVCPANVAGHSRFGTRAFRPDGSDVGCQYETPDGQSILTLYFSDFGDLPANEHVRQMIPAIARSKGLNPVEAKSLECQTVLALTEAGDAIGQDEAAEAVIGPTPCVIFSGQGQTSLLSVRTYGDWHFKIRLTSPDTGEAGDMAMYETAGELMVLQDNSVRPKSAQPGKKAT